MIDPRNCSSSPARAPSASPAADAMASPSLVDGSVREVPTYIGAPGFRGSAVELEGPAVLSPHGVASIAELLGQLLLGGQGLLLGGSRQRVALPVQGLEEPDAEVTDDRGRGLPTLLVLGIALLRRLGGHADVDKRQPPVDALPLQRRDAPEQALPSLLAELDDVDGPLLVLGHATSMTPTIPVRSRPALGPPTGSRCRARWRSAPAPSSCAGTRRTRRRRWSRDRSRSPTRGSAAARG